MIGDLPVAPPIDPRQRRHSTKTMALARRMYAGGWTPTQIVDYLAGRGTRVSLNTVRLWVIPGMADEHRVRNNASAARRRVNNPAGPAPGTELLSRMLELRAAGLSYLAIAKVVALDFGVELSAEQSRYYVQAKRDPKLPKKRAA